MPERIVVVDDHPDSRDVAVLALEHGGFVVQSFGSAEEAWSAVLTSPPAVVVTDVTLPGLDGSEFARRLRAHPSTRHVALIAVTGRASIAAKHFERVVPKPFDPAALCGAVRLVLVERARVATVAQQPAEAARRTSARELRGPGPATPVPVADAPSAGAVPWRQWLEHAPTMMWSAGRDARRMWFNAGWLAFTGRTIAQESGDGWLEGVHDDDRERLAAAAFATSARREAFDVHYRLRRHDGQCRWILERVSPCFDEVGAFTGYVGACIDVDEQRRLEATKAQFLDLMAHELRTPLTPLCAHLHVLGARAARGQVVSADVVAKLTRQTERLIELVDKVGDAARLELGKTFRLSLEQVDLAALVRDVVARFVAGRSSELQDQTVNVSLPDSEAPPCSLDGEAIARVLRLLLDNAVRFSVKPAYVAVRLSIGREAVIVVEDHGMGIPPADLTSIGRPYFHASNAPPTHYPGMGLGLSVASEIVRAHGGSLTVDSQLGVGTRVSVTLTTSRASSS